MVPNEDGNQIMCRCLSNDFQHRFMYALPPYTSRYSISTVCPTSLSIVARGTSTKAGAGGLEYVGGAGGQAEIPRWVFESYSPRTTSGKYTALPERTNTHAGSAQLPSSSTAYPTTR